MKQKDTLVNEVASLKVEVQQVRDDRDQQLLQLQILKAEVAKYKDLAINSRDLEVGFLSPSYLLLSSINHLMHSLNNFLKVCCFLLQARCSSQSNQIRTLQDQLAAAERKLQVCHIIFWQIVD